jgi:hypothetical protein
LWPGAGVAHDISPLILAILLVVAHFPAPGQFALRIALSTALALLYIPVIYFALLACHSLYLLSYVFVVFALGALSIAQSPERGLRLNAEATAEMKG